MKDEHLCIANETVQQLRNFGDFITSLPLNATRKLYYTQLMKNQQLRMQSEVLELDFLKVQLFAKLQQDILNKDSFEQQTPQSIIQTQNRVMQIYEKISETLPLSQEVIRVRIIIAIINFKFRFREGFTPRLSFDTLLAAIQQLNLWQTFLEGQNSLTRYFYLCLMWQYLFSQDVQNYMQIVNLYAGYLLKSIRNKQKSNNSSQQVNQILVDLLQCHHSFKLFKKQYNLDYLLTDESQIYSVLYQLDCSLSQQIIYQYKKLNTKTRSQIIEATMCKIGAQILNYNEKDVDKQLHFQVEKSKANHILLRPARPSMIIRRKSNSRMMMVQSLKKKEADLKPINNLFVPKRVNTNIQLERRFQLRRRMKSSNENIKSSSNLIKHSKRAINKLNAGKQIRIGLKPDHLMKPSVQKPTYESCKKYSIGKHQELQMMICQRRSGVSLKLNCNGEQNTIVRASIDRDRNNSAKKKRVLNRKGSNLITLAQKSEQKRGPGLEADNARIVIPSIIRLALAQYVKGFLTYFKYQHFKYSMPLYIAFKNLNKANFYYLKGEIIQFTQVYTQGLNMFVVYTTKQKQLKTVAFKLYEYNQSNVRQLFIHNKKISKLEGFYKIGGNLTFYWFNLQIRQPSAPTKLQVSQICYENEIYSYNVWLTGEAKRIHYKKIIEEQQSFIKRVDESLKMDFKYDKQTNENLIKNKSETQPLIWRSLMQINFQKAIHEWHTLQSIRISLKKNDKYQIYAIKHLQHLKACRNYLLFQSFNPFKLGTQFNIIPCIKKLDLQTFLKNVRSWQEVTTKMKKKHFIVQERWIDVVLNKSLFEIKVKKYVAKSLSKGYQVFVVQSLIDKALDLIKGQQGKLKWFFLVNLKQFQPTHKKTEQKQNKPIKPNPRRSINTFADHTIKTLATHISIKSKKAMPSAREAMESTHTSLLNLLKKEGKKVFLGRQQFNCIEYEYSWLLYINKKTYYCFNRFLQVFVLIIKNSKFLYIQSYRVSQHNHNRQLIFSQFRRLLTIKLASKAIVYSRWGIVGVAQIIKNSVLIKFSEVQGNYSIQVSLKELYGLDSPQVNLTHQIFSNKPLLKRIIRISSQKLAQRPIIAP